MLIDELRDRDYQFIHGSETWVFDLPSATKFAVKMEKKGYRCYVVPTLLGRYIVAIRPKLIWGTSFGRVTVGYRGFVGVYKSGIWICYDCKGALCGWNNDVKGFVRRVNSILL